MPTKPTQESSSDKQQKVSSPANPVAILAVVFAILSVFIYPLPFGIVAIILGAMAVGQGESGKGWGAILVGVASCFWALWQS